MSFSRPELKARIADAIWIRSRNHKCAHIAMEEYLKSSENLENSEQWRPASERLERAFHLGRTINDKPSSATVMDRIGKFIESSMSHGYPHPVAELLTTLAEWRAGDPIKHAKIATDLAEKTETINDFESAKRLWVLAGKWWGIAGQKDQARAARIRGAETNVRKADLLEQGEQPSHLLISAFLEQTIQEFRQIGGEKDRVDKLQSRLLKSQEKSVMEMKTISAPIVFPQENIDRAVNLVKGKSLLEAIRILANIVPPISKNRLKKDVDEMAKHAPLLHSMPARIVDQTGRVVGRRPAFLMTDSDKVDEATKAMMISHARFHRGLAAIVIDAVRQQILLEHPVTEKDWDPFVTGNPFIPVGRERIFLKGLHAGLTGNFLVSSHLLMPQLENSFREILQSQGIPVTKFDNDGFQELINLQEILPKQEFKDLFGEDVSFDLQALLVEHDGPNLRNGTFHGFRSYESFFSGNDTYLWWLVLRFCWIASKNAK